MNTECTLNQLRGLMQLLRTESSDSSSDEEEDNKKNNLTEKVPGDIGIKSKLTKDTSTCNDLSFNCLNENMVSKTLEEYESIHEENQTMLDGRLEPEYTISYKQNVTTEEIFLGMSNKNASIAACDFIVLEIQLPEETATIDEMELSVSENHVNFSSLKYKAKIPLPHAVDSNKGKAIYNSEYNLLKLVLKMDREFDY